MNTGSCSYVSLFKMVLLLIFSCDMTGCAVINLMQAAPVSEEMTPQSVICGKDGSIAIRVTSSYTHLSFPTLFAYQHFWIFFESLKQDKDYDPYKEIPVKFHKPRDRYLVLAPTTIQAKIKAVQPGPGKVYSIESASYSDPDYTDYLADYLFGSYTKTADEVTFIPHGFWASRPSPSQLPPSLRPPIASEHKLDEVIPYQLGSDTVYLKFSKFRAGGRTGLTWWGYPVMIGIYYAPLTVTCVAYKLPQLPFILLHHAFAPKEDNRFTKPQP